MRNSLLAFASLASFAVAVAAWGAPAKPAPASGEPAASKLGAAVASLPFRGLGPALMGGRIADIAVDPTRPGTFYVAAGSGGIFKTTNGGVTFKAIFEGQPSYSIGEITLDPSHPEVIWVGTGENVSGRHVGWGDGVYRSRDGGESWQRMGLAGSQHIGRILVDPRDSQVVLVAAEGPLWSAGGERGVYRSRDGGATFEPVLQVDENTGFTDLEFDPGNPEVVYAAAYQRRRHVWGFLGGGPGSGLWKSVDNGKTWRRLEKGLPKGDMGKIGLAVSAADPRVVYATIEAGPLERGFYRSLDRGESWEKRNSYISGGTGPHYYQEIEASPVNAELVYQMDVFLRVTRNGGASFEILETGRDKHSDNHALYIDPANGNHLLGGTDGGLYESFDEGKTWRHFPNLPIEQLYKVAVNSREPFYDILVGAQDLGTLHGPSRTMNGDGVRNQDWYVPFGADGYGVAFDPQDPDLMYLMSQEGNLFRKDRRNDEGLMIRPQPAPGEAPERWNWDSPLLVSPHHPERIYFGSQRIFRSDDRGHSWKPISGDLTGGEFRYDQKFSGRVFSVDALFDHNAMSKYATTTAISESPVAEGRLVVGTDDGRVQLSADGGQSWKSAAPLPGLPELSFVNDVEMSVVEAASLFVVADNHKNGDFSPYVFESRDFGKSWQSLAGDLPKGVIVWAIQQDDVDPDLLFLGTERGIEFSPDHGRHWYRLGGLPTIPFRDLKLHRRDRDLVGASFGRGVYLLDDYTALRGLAAAVEQEGTLFPVRDAWSFVPYQTGQAPGRPELGTDDFKAANPPHGALFTYYLRDQPEKAKDKRATRERQLREQGMDIPFPGFAALRQEALESGPKVLIAISDSAGKKVRLLEGPAKAGLQRLSWDLRGPSPDPVELEEPAFRSPWDEPTVGPLVAPGRYTAELMLISESGNRTLGQPQSFLVRPVPNLSPGTDPAAVAAFQQRTAAAARRRSALAETIGEAREELRHLEATLLATPQADPTLFGRVGAIKSRLAALELELSGDPARARLHESDAPAISDRLDAVIGGHWKTRQMPTATQQRDLEIAEAGLDQLEKALVTLVENELAELHRAFAAAGAPWTKGRPLRE